MLLFAEGGFFTPFFLLVRVLIIGFLLFRTQRYQIRRIRNGGPIVRTEQPQAPNRGHHLDAPADVLRWEVQMHETARDLSGQLDSKMGVLEQLIREADRAAARLETALESARGTQPTTPAPTEAADTRPEPTEPPDPSPSRPISQAEGLKLHRAADRVSAAGASEPAEAEAHPPAERRYEEIYLLADYGFDAAEIARRVGTPVGEVELILGLRGKR